MEKRESLIAYASNFVSFLLDRDISKKINKIILFGSVARGDFNEESDIDIFIDTYEKIGDEAEKVLKMFNNSQANKIWELKGIKRVISLKVGDLSKWSLKRSVISNGILLYGKYNEIPKEAKYYLMVQMSNLNKMKTSLQMRLWRRLYGYKQKIGKKIYVGKGLVEKLGGKKIGKATIIVPMEKEKEVTNFLNKNKIQYKVYEIWSDSFD